MPIPAFALSMILIAIAAAQAQALEWKWRGLGKSFHELVQEGYQVVGSRVEEVPGQRIQTTYMLQKGKSFVECYRAIEKSGTTYICRELVG